MYCECSTNVPNCSINILCNAAPRAVCYLIVALRSKDVEVPKFPNCSAKANTEVLFCDDLNDQFVIEMIFVDLVNTNPMVISMVKLVCFKFL
jgi:hypothetical protein